MALIGRNLFIGSDEKIFIGTDGYDKTTEPTFVGVVTPSDGAADDNFGATVAIGYGKIVVGSRADDVSSNTDQGSVYIYDLDGNNEVKITASDGAAGDWFGQHVAVGSGRIVVATTRDNSEQGAVYIFDLDGNQLSKITASDGAVDDFFGRSVAVGSGKIVVGADGDDDNGSFSGSAYIYDLDGTNEIKITASDGAANDRFGGYVDIGSGRILVAASNKNSNRGAVYIYDLHGNEVGIITASDGSTGEYFGRLSIGFNKIIIGAWRHWANFNDQGAIYIYDLDGNNDVKITASDAAANDQFGYWTAVGNGRIVVGAAHKHVNGNSDQGAIYIYDLDGNEVGIITASDGVADDLFGYPVAVGDGRIVAGSIYRDLNSNSNVGGIYIYSTPESDHILDILDK